MAVIIPKNEWNFKWKFHFFHFWSGKTVEKAENPHGLHLKIYANGNYNGKNGLYIST